MALDPGLALTPPMGFNTWNRFAGNIDQNLIEQTMDTMANQGWRELGYIYLNIDDGWMAPQRDDQGRFVPDPVRFPGGIRRLADRAHSLGLKLGIYSCCGYKTCMGLPASYNHERIDAETFAEWGVDYLKQDWCHVPYEEFPGKSHREVAEILYGRISDAIASTGQAMVLSMCNWGDGEPWLWGAKVAHLWRTTSDIADAFSQKPTNGTWDLVSIFRKNSRLAAYAGPGHFNDPDMLEVGNGGMSVEEYQSHFALWCMMAAPLLIGADMRDMAPEIRAILANTDLIAINQDRLGIQAEVVDEHDDLFTLVKPLSNGDRAVALFNASDSAQSATLTWNSLAPLKRQAKDLWSGKVETLSGSSTLSLPGHETRVWRVI